MSPQFRLIALSFLAFVLIVTGAQAILRSVHFLALANAPKPPPVPCVGDPIIVNEDYGGGAVKAWSCQVQCDDNKPRYLMYKNGYATQCGSPPNCFDEGEDRGVTCEVPLKSTLD